MVAVVAGAAAATLVGTPPTPVEAANSLVTVDSAGNVGGLSSLTLDAASNPVISYYDVTNGDLKLAHCNDPNCVDGGESIVAVDGNGNVGQYTSLALDAGGNPVISYYDVTNGDLKLAHCNDVNCVGGGESIVAVDGTGDRGQYSSLVLDAAGDPVISYFDASTTALRLVHCNDADCAGGGESFVTLDNGAFVGVYGSLELDAAGSPVISYNDASNADLKLAHCNDPNCVGGGESIVTLDGAIGDVGLFTSLELGAGGEPVISYFDTSNTALKVARCNNANCTGGGNSIVTVDNSGDVGRHSSLQLDAAGKPVVSYQASGSGDLKLVHCVDANCVGGGTSIVTVDQLLNVGWETSLVLDAAGYPVVSHRDETLADLKLAHCETATCAAPACAGATATIAGTAGNDVINGTDGADVIAAGGGNDTINGLDGDDIICGDDGSDVIAGGAGRDGRGYRHGELRRVGVTGDRRSHG